MRGLCPFVPAAPPAAAAGIIAGDCQSAFTIADRVGLSIELIPHLFGAAQGNLPTGQRGLFAYWRSGSKVVVPEVLRHLETI